MPRRLILHCGPPKTGTSAIQSLLRDAPPVGVCYPQTGQWPDGAHHKLIFALQGLDRRGPVKIPIWEDQLNSLVAELDAADRDVVISSESLSPDLLTQFLGRVQPRLARGFDDISAIIVLRHPLEWAASTYNQDIKDPVVKENRLPDRYLDEFGGNFRLMPLIRNWQQRAPIPVSFLSYHPAGDLVARFFRLIEHENGTAAPASRRRNASISFYALAALLCGRRAGLSAEQQAGLFQALRGDTRRPVWKGPSFPFSAPAVNRYLRRVVEEDLSQVKAAIGITLPDLRAEPPRRRPLSAAQVEAIRNHFATFALRPPQIQRLDRTLAALSAPDPAGPGAARAGIRATANETGAPRHDP